MSFAAGHNIAYGYVVLSISNVYASEYGERASEQVVPCKKALKMCSFGHA